MNDNFRSIAYENSMVGLYTLQLTADLTVIILL